MSQSLVKIYVHIVFSTKNRVPFFKDDLIREQSHAYLAGILENLDSPVQKIGGPADHVHVLCMMSKNRLVPRVVGEMKRASSLWIKNHGGILGSFQWQDGYGAFSVGQREIVTIANYIATQIEHHSKADYKTELLSILEEHGMEYDEQRIWE